MFLVINRSTFVSTLFSIRAGPFIFILLRLILGKNKLLDYEFWDIDCDLKLNATKYGYKIVYWNNVNKDNQTGTIRSLLANTCECNCFHWHQFGHSEQLAVLKVSPKCHKPNNTLHIDTTSNYNASTMVSTKWIQFRLWLCNVCSTFFNSCGIA